MKKKLHKELFKLWVEKALEKWGNIDIIDGDLASAFHHYIPRSKSLALRYDIMNAVPLNKKNHYIIHFSKNPDEVRRLCDIIRKKRGKEWCEYIETHKKQNAKNAIWWLEEQKDRLNASL